MGAQQRRSRRHQRASLSEWQEPPSSLQDWRSTSPTVRSIKENADRFRVSLEAVRRGLHTARFSAVSSGKDAKLRIIHYLKASLTTLPQHKQKQVLPLPKGAAKKICVLRRPSTA